MKITVSRQPKRNAYVIESSNGCRANVGTYSALKAAVISVGWMSSCISRKSFADDLRRYRKFKREGRIA